MQTEIELALPELGTWKICLFSSYALGFLYYLKPGINVYRGRRALGTRCLARSKQEKDLQGGYGGPGEIQTNGSKLTVVFVDAEKRGT